MPKNLEERIAQIYKKIASRKYDIIDEVDNLYQDAIQQEDYSIALNCLTEKIYVLVVTNQILESNQVISMADSLMLAQKINKKIVLGYYINKALALSNQGKQSESLELYLKVLELGRELNEFQAVASASLQVGDHYFNLKVLDKAEQYLKDALKYITESKIDKRAWLAYYKLGYTYLESKDYEKAKEFLQKSYKEADQIDHMIGKVLSLQNLAECELLVGKKEEALEMCEEALHLSNENVGLDQFYNSISITKVMILQELKQYMETIKILDDVFSKNKIEGFFLALHEHYVISYEGLEDYRNALKHQRLFTELKEKIYGLDLQKHTEELESKYQNKLKESEKEILRLQKIEMEQKAIRAQLNPHFFFNALNSINKFILDNDQRNASKFLQNFSGLMRKTLENSEEMFITIEDEIAFLTDYLSLEQLRFNNSFSFEFNVDKEIEEDFVKIPTMMLQPYVENCVKHGLVGLENGRINIDFKLLETDQIQCTIEDNGVGRVKPSESEHKSMGTKLLEERMALLKEQYQLDFSLDIIDLFDDKQKACGTKVILLIPIINT